MRYHFVTFKISKEGLFFYFFMMLTLAKVRQNGTLYMHRESEHPSWNAIEQYV